ncbi:MAG: ABC transporter ATP-binding protein [Actinomycetota bacterium]
MGMLDLKNISIRFGGVQALDDVSFSLKRGEILGLIGPNGAGKTTLFNCVSGVLKPDEGTIVYEGKDLAGLRPNKRAHLGIARTFQNLQLFGSMTVLENLMVPLDAFASRTMIGDAFRLPRAHYEERRAEEHARAILHFLGLSEHTQAAAGSLPVGLQRRVELGRALCLKPKLLLLDEPAAGLDAAETVELADLLPEIRARFGVTMLLVDHDMALVMRACDYIYVLDFGKLISDGPPQRVGSDPVVVKAYLGEQEEVA